MARFNTALTSSIISGTATIGTPYSGAFTEFTGTAPYTVTLPSPTLFPGVNQTFYHATSGQVTLSVSGATFNGTGGTGSATFVLNAGNVVSIFSDGTNYIVISEDGSPLTATTGSFSGNVTINGGSATLSATPQTITLNPTSTSTIDNINIGGTTRGSGAFNTLTANQAVTFTAGTASSTTGTGTLVVTGGLGVSGNINSGGTVTGTNLAGTITTASQPNITSVGNLATTGLTVNTTAIVTSGTNNVGINTASPKTNGATFGTLTLNGSNGGAIQFTTNDTNIAQIYNDANALFINPSSGKTLSLQNNGTTTVSVGASTVGITGTTNISAKVTISTFGSRVRNLEVYGSDVLFDAGDGTFNLLIGDGGFAYMALHTTDNATALKIRDHTGNGDIVTIERVSRNVGIGTSSPAYKLHVAGTQGVDDPRITAIAASIAATATDVFVYDTSRDSDGGAWRKRTQHTSWYNETLNTATRGSRQEFPAVAVLVLTSSTLTIYDGDDPTLPMWMVFNFPAYTQATGNLGDTPYCIGYNTLMTKSLTTVRIVNGKLFVGNGAANSANALWDVNFISEISYEYYNYPTNNTNLTRTRVAGTIIYRNSNIILQGSPTSRYGSDANLPIPTPVKFLSAVVLTGARIDPLTQLPIPTLYVGSDAGVGVILDDYSGRKFTYNYAAWVGKGLAANKYTGRFIHLITDGVTGSVNGAYGAGLADVVSGSNPTFGTAWTSAYPGGTGWSGLGYPTLYYTRTNSGNIVQAVASVATPPSNSSIPPLAPGYWGSINTGSSAQANPTYYPTWAVSTNLAFSLINENPYDYRSGMVAHIGTTFNSGWLQGNIKGAWMSSNATGSITSTNLVTDSTFSSGITGWTQYNSTLSWFSSNSLRCTSTVTGSVSGATFSFSTTIGKTYYIKADVAQAGQTGLDARVQISGIGLIHGHGQSTVTGSTSIYDTFIATSTSHALEVLSYNPATGGTITIDNVLICEADSDRASSIFGLVAVGTVNKTVVNTSADLVGYGPFSNGNYLYQSYTSALDFGTGDFCYMGWVKQNWIGSSGACILQRGVAVNSNEFVTYIGSDGAVLFRVNTSANTLSTGAGMLPTNQWAHLAFTRTNGVTRIWINGIVHATGASTESMTQVGYALNFGQWTTNNGYWINGGMALWRASASVPNPDQMFKIWSDENQLFQINAKATLYGSSDTVGTFNYEDDAQLLHAGTTSGRSSFRGLQRVSNTTTSSSGMISTGKGMVLVQ